MRHLKLLLLYNINTPARQISCNSAAITKVHRTTYCCAYPTLIVRPDGSSIRARYHEPRQIVTIPLDMSTLTDAEKKIRIEARKPKTVIKVEDAYKDTFDRKKYLRFIKK